MYHRTLHCLNQKNTPYKVENMMERKHGHKMFQIQMLIINDSFVFMNYSSKSLNKNIKKPNFTDMKSI